MPLGQAAPEHEWLPNLSEPDERGRRKAEKQGKEQAGIACQIFLAQVYQVWPPNWRFDVQDLLIARGKALAWK